jgi:hypothetical protein
VVRRARPEEGVGLGLCVLLRREPISRRARARPASSTDREKVPHFPFRRQRTSDFAMVPSGDI